MSRTLRIPAMMVAASLTWVSGTAVAQGPEGSSLSFAAGVSLWDGVGIGLAYHEARIAPRTPILGADVFDGVGVSERYYQDSYPDYEFERRRCRWYRDDYVDGWYDRYDDYGRRCRRRVSRWGLAMSFGFGWHYPAYYRSWFAGYDPFWHDPFWSPWYSFDPWFGRGWLAFGWHRPNSFYGYSYPVFHSYPVYYGPGYHSYVPRSRYLSRGRLAYGSGYVNTYPPVSRIEYKESPRRTAVARTARVVPRTTAPRVSSRAAPAVSAGVARRSGDSARPRVVRPEPRSATTARLSGSGGSAGVSPRTRTASPRVQPRTSAPPNVRSRPAPAPRIQPRPSAPRARPRASAPPSTRSRPAPAPRVQSRPSAPRARPRASTPPSTRSRPAPAPRVQSRPSAPRARPRASTPPSTRSRPAPAPRVQSRPSAPRARPRASTPPSARSRPAPAPRVRPRPSAPRARPRASTPPSARSRPAPTPRARPPASAPPTARPRPSAPPRASARPTRPNRRPPGRP